MSLSEQVIQITGSARADCDHERLLRVHAFVRALVREVLSRDGALIVLAGREPQPTDPNGPALIFDWTVLEEVALFLRADSYSATSRRRCIVVTAPSSEQHRIPENRVSLFNELRYSNATIVEYVADDIYTGETIRRKLLDHSSAIVSIGGGKGVAVLAANRGERPLLPLDIQIGSSCNDGEGSISLRREAVAYPERFFKADTSTFKRELPRISLEDRSQSPEAVASRTAELLAHELGIIFNNRERSRPPTHIPEMPMLHPTITQSMLDIARIKPWNTLPELESLYLIDKLQGPEIQEIKRRLQLLGICRIRFAGQRPDTEIIKAVARNFGEVMTEQNDFQGQVKDITPQHGVAATTGDSAAALGPHVDGTQYVRQPALLIFQYVRTADYGAESTFWDLAHILLELDPVRRAALLTALAHPEAGAFGKKGREFRGPMATVTAQNTVMLRERFDAVVGVHESVREAHEYLRERLKRQGMVYVPARGDLVIFDNGRILHGREEVGGDAQRLHRRMWISDLRGDLQAEMLLGVRPLEPEILAKLPKRG
jgi:alpha-ketoglutarate-dependent taurine dioxygenase